MELAFPHIMTRFEKFLVSPCRARKSLVAAFALLLVVTMVWQDGFWVRPPESVSKASLLLDSIISSHAVVQTRIPGAKQTFCDRLVKFHTNHGVCTQMSFCTPLAGCAATCSACLAHASTINTSTWRWDDVAYNDSSRASWKAIEHLERVVTIGQCWNCPVCQSQLDNKVLEAGLGALRIWLCNDPSNSNWWWQDIGTPEYVVVSLILFQHHITEHDLDLGLKIVQRAERLLGATGENGLWAEEIRLERGCLENDEELFRTGMQSFWRHIKVVGGADEGIKPDGTFFQHNELLQSGSYGASELLNILVFAGLSQDIPGIEMPTATYNVVSTFVLDGSQWMMWFPTKQGDAGVSWDVSARGREIVRPTMLVTGAWVSALKGLATYAAKHTEDMGGDWSAGWTALEARISSHQHHAPLVGTKHFYFSDFTIHRRSTFMITTKMTSNRTFNAEVTNGEGLCGWHMSNGVTFIYSDGNEYTNIFPLWDWTALPGSTLLADTTGPLKHRGINYFAGGATMQVGKLGYGVSGMDFTSIDFGADTVPVPVVVARKSWFWVDEGFIALGSGITVSSVTLLPNYASKHVRTTIEQSMLGPDMLVDGQQYGHQGDIALRIRATPSSWVYHTHKVYLPSLVGEVDVQLGAESRHGNWKTISDSRDETAAGKVFSLALDHGTATVNASYAYAVLPNCCEDHPSIPEAIASFRTKMSILHHNNECHALQYQTQTQVFVFAVVFATMSIQLASIGSALVFRDVSEPSFVVVSEPIATARLSTLTISIATPSNATSLSLAVNRRLNACSGTAGRITNVHISPLLDESNRTWTTVLLEVHRDSHIFPGESFAVSCTMNFEEQSDI